MNQIRIVVVEDNPADARYIEFLLEERDGIAYDYHRVEQLNEAIAYLEANACDVILLDLSLPDSQGLDTLTSLLDAVEDAAVIVITGWYDQALGIQALQLGAQDYLSKGKFDSDLLARTIRYAVERNRIQVAERQQRVLADALRDAATTAALSLDLDEIFASILEQVHHVVPHDRSNIMLVEKTQAEIRCCRGYAASEQAKIVGAVLSLEDYSHLDKVCTTQQAVIIDEHTCPFNPNPHSYIGLPMRYHGDEVIGLMVLQADQTGFFTTRHAEILQAFADQTAIATENARLYQESQSFNDWLLEAVSEATEKLQRVKNRTETILSNVPDAMLVLRPDGRIQQGNAAFTDVFGYIPDELIRATPIELTLPADTHIVETLITTATQEGESSRAEARMVCANGRVFDADIAITPIVIESAVNGIVCSIRDISHQKEAQRIKDEFASNVSHEMRNLITSMKLSLNIMEQRPDRAPDMIERIRREIARMQATVDNLLMLGKLARNEVAITLKPLDINTFVGELLADRHLIATQNNLSLLFEPSDDQPVALADSTLMEKVLEILLSNAFNYTPAGGTITVRAVYGDTQVGFAVQDTGMGIAEADQESIFQRFHRGQKVQKTNITGTGLGLSIAQDIIDHHKGNIDVYSAGEHKGTTFTVLLDKAPHNVNLTR